MGKPIDKIIMFHLAVGDIEKTKAFFVNILGFKTTKDSNDFLPGTDRWVTMEAPGGGAAITLTTVHENMKPGTMKLYISAPDIEKAFKELTDKGLKPRGGIRHEQWGTAFEFRDPEGNQWVVMQS